MAALAMWAASFEALPVGVKTALSEAEYSSPELLKRCFWVEDPAKLYERIDKYGRHLLLDQRVDGDVQPANVDFHPVMGKLRGLLEAATLVVEEQNHDKLKLVANIKAGEFWCHVLKLYYLLPLPPPLGNALESGRG